MIWRLGALMIGAIAILVLALVLAGVGPLATLTTLIRGSLGSSAAIGGTLRETTPLLIAGLAVFIGLRAGLFNIGVEGQFLIGAMVTAVIALLMPSPLGMFVATLGGMAGGALWALPAGWIRAYRNGHEVITTIMLNSVAALFTTALVAGPLKDPSSQAPSTRSLPASLHLPDLYNHPPVTVSSGLLVGIAVSLAIAFWLRRTVAGYELEATGASPEAARFAGIDSRRVIVLSMLASGALGGLAGAVQVLAYEGRFYSGFSPGYGFDALGVALLAGSNALAVLPASLLFGILAKGGTSLEIDGVPKGITTVVLGFLIIIAAAIRYRRPNAPD